MIVDCIIHNYYCLLNLKFLVVVQVPCITEDLSIILAFVGAYSIRFEATALRRSKPTTLPCPASVGRVPFTSFHHERLLSSLLFLLPHLIYFINMRPMEGCLFWPACSEVSNPVLGPRSHLLFFRIWFNASYIVHFLFTAFSMFLLVFTNFILISFLVVTQTLWTHILNLSFCQ